MIKLNGLVNNRYRIIEKIGQGGMAVVYKAFDTTLNRFVALKVIRSEAFGIETISRITMRFEREAHMLAKLNHPNIVKVYDYGNYQGVPYLVMDYLNGTTMKEINKPVSVEKACEYLIPIAKGVEHAHQQGVLHRDIKPANILITQLGEVMLTDFGIAKLIEGNEDTSLTGTGVGIGTPEYMAPEQGLDINVDHRADIYSLGVVMYELLTGRKPFLADTPLAVLFKQMNDPLPNPLLFNSRLTDDVIHFLYRSLAKRPEDRFATMDEMIKGLNELMLGDYRKSAVSYGTPDFSKLSYSDGEETLDQISSQPKKLTLRNTQERIMKWAFGIIILVLLAGLLLILQDGFLGRTFSTNFLGTKFASVTVTNNQYSGLDSRKTDVSGTLIPSLQPTGMSIKTLESTKVPELMVITKDNFHQLQLVNELGKGSIDQLALMNDEKTLLVMAGGHNYLYDTRTLTTIDPVIPSFPERIITISADGKYAVAEFNGEYVIWDVQEKKSLMELPSDIQDSNLSFSLNNKYLLETSEKYFATWDLSKKELAFKREMEIDYSSYYYSIVNSDGIVLAPVRFHVEWAAESYTIVVRNLNEDKDVCSIKPGKSISEIRISPDGRTVTAMTVYDQLLVYEISSCSRLGIFNIPDDIEMGSNAPPFFKYSPDGEFLAVNDANYKLHILEISSGVELVQSISDPDEDMFIDVLFSNSMDRLYSISLSGALKVWEGDPWVLVNSLDEYFPNYHLISIRENEVAFLTPKNVSDSHIQILDTESGKFREKLLISYDVTSLDLSESGHLLVAAGRDGIIRVYLTDGLGQINELHGHLSSVQVISFSPDDRLLASGGSDGSIILWDISTGRNVRTLVTGYMWPVQILFSPDSSVLVVKGSEWFEAWDVKSGSMISGANTSLGTLKFMKTGQLIGVVEEEDGSLFVVEVDMKNGTYEKTFSAGNFRYGNFFGALPEGIFAASHLDFSPDEHILIVGNKFFNFDSGEQLVFRKITSATPFFGPVFLQNGKMIYDFGRSSFAVYGIWQ